MAMRPTSQLQIFPTVEIAGVGGGLFVYNASRTALLESIAAAATTDPILGTAVPAGTATYNGHGAVVNLLSVTNSAFFQYRDLGTAVQGSLILSVASVAGTDPVDGTAYPAGLTGTNPAFGNFTQVVGDQILLGAPAFTVSAQVFGRVAPTSADRPVLRVDAPEQTTASHLQMLLGGASPDASKAAQLLIGLVAGAALLTPGTQAPVEVQGQVAASSTVALVSGAAEAWHHITTGAPAGWTIDIAYRFLTEVGLVMVQVIASVANGTAVTFAETIATLPAGPPSYQPSNGKGFGCAFFNGTVDSVQPFVIQAGGAIQYAGAGFTAGATAQFVGQVIFTTLI